MVKKETKPQFNQSICPICNKIIYKNVDDYCNLKDFNKGKFYCEAFYHTKCFNEKIKGSKEINDMKSKAMKLLNAAGKMIGLEEDKPKEVVYIH